MSVCLPAYNGSKAVSGVFTSVPASRRCWTAWVQTSSMPLCGAQHRQTHMNTPPSALPESWSSPCMQGLLDSMDSDLRYMVEVEGKAGLSHTH